MTSALAAERGQSDAASLVQVDWTDVPPLPFELAGLPRAAFRWLRLHVVSYALPALIAIGQLLHQRRPSLNPLVRGLRRLSVNPTLGRLEAIQPPSGGFLEAVPLTSFVVMALAGAGRAEHPVAERGLEFLKEAVRNDGGWPIDMDLATWVTTLSVQALSAGGRSVPEADKTARWLVDHQHTARHPYTDAPPGGWAWTHRSGGVPDADDTAGALLALAELDPDGADDAASAGLHWLLGLQNRNGGWPTFCRGWGRLPFDRSAPDLTAHVLRAVAAWPQQVEERRRGRATTRGFAYLRRTQREDGAWLPLWFGNQHAPEHENPVYGTARVLLAYRDLGRRREEAARRGASFLLDAQAPDGGWGGDRGIEPTVEETALAVQALAAWGDEAACAAACLRGARHLAARIEARGLEGPAAIGLYFARLWYSERLYPIILSVGALGSVLPASSRDEAT
jgi:squalene-hopene/tetraprenyl-beta-curcumene cyclase